MYSFSRPITKIVLIAKQLPGFWSMTIISVVTGTMFVALVARGRGIPHGGCRRQGMLALSQIVVPAMSLSTVASLSPPISSLLRDPSLIPVIEESASTFEVLDPSNPNSVLAKVPIMAKPDAQAAIQLSAEVLPSWRDGTTAYFRAGLLQKWSALMNENLEDLAIIMTMETGKPMAESRGEVNYARSFLDYYAGEGIRSSGAGGGKLLPSPFATPDGAPRGQVMATQQAVGVTALITPWNFPSAMITRKVGPALAAGCTAVVKPSELTPLSALALKTLADRAGIPSSVIQIVTADSASTPEVGTEFCTNPLVKKISFTGSTRVGKLLMKLSSDTVKRVSLELGGNAPFVVFEDADLDQAVAAAMASKFRNAGQTCVCADRFLVHSSIHDVFVVGLVEKVRALQLGAGIKGCSMGPLITENAAQSVSQKVKDAMAQGAICEIGGNRLPELGIQFYEPTVLTNVSLESDIWKTESFAPVVAIVKFDTEEEALQIANNSDVGLASYFCTQDLGRALRFSQRLESGIVGVNEGIISTSSAPFGGVKQSGLGREGGPWGLAEFLETKYIFLNT